MAGRSSIEWTDCTWNPVTDWTNVSPGCTYCYADRLAHRLHAMGNPCYASGFEVTGYGHVPDTPLHWKQPRSVFANSMSHLVHERILPSFVRRVFAVMLKAYWRSFEVLAKRLGRLLEPRRELSWPPKVWLGVSVERGDYMFRIDHLRDTNAAVEFLSLEPMLGPLPKLDLNGIDWVIAGGGASPRARPVVGDWFRDIRDRCLAFRVPFFFKQWGGANKTKAGRLLDGRTWDEMPQEACWQREGV
jgi:protein gp37